MQNIIESIDVMTEIKTLCVFRPPAVNANNWVIRGDIII